MAWREHNNQVSICCPLAPRFHEKGKDSRPSLSIKYSDTDPTLWKCFTCLESGKLWQLFDSVGVITGNDSMRDYARSLIVSDEPTLETLLAQACCNLDDYFEPPVHLGALILDNKILNGFPRAYDTIDGRDYLWIKRGVSEERADFWDLRFDYRNDRLLFPVRNQSGELVGAVGRALDDKHPKRYYNYFNFRSGATLGGLDRVKKENFSVAVVEGYFDLVKGFDVCQDLGLDILCTFHAEVTPEQQNILQTLDKNVLLCYDMDKAGETGAEKALKALKSFIPIRRLSWEGDEDVAELPDSKWRRILQSATEVKIVESRW